MATDETTPIVLYRSGRGLVLIALSIIIVPFSMATSEELTPGFYVLPAILVALYLVAAAKWWAKRNVLLPDRIVVRDLMLRRIGRMPLLATREVPLSEIGRVDVERVGASRQYTIDLYPRSSYRIHLEITQFRRQQDLQRLVAAIAESAPAVVLNPRAESLRAGTLPLAREPSRRTAGFWSVAVLLCAELWVWAVPQDATRHQPGRLLVLDQVLAVYTAGLILFALYRLASWWLSARRQRPWPRRRASLAIVCVVSGCIGLAIFVVLIVVDVWTGYGGDWGKYGLGPTILGWSLAVLMSGGSAAAVSL